MSCEGWGEGKKKAHGEDRKENIFATQRETLWEREIRRKQVICSQIPIRFSLSYTGRKNGFASNLLSANMMQICANWGINLSKGGKCRCYIPFTTGCK